METPSVSPNDEAVCDKSVAVMPSKDEYEGLDVFGTEAFDSVCGVDILDPLYRPDVKRVISLWSILLLAVTSVLTLGFFGCFRRLKGPNLDLSRNLWNEDLFWTSLVIFMLTCLAITCGLSALASHANLYSHAKVLGFRRVFRWCFALHATAAVFTLIVALKLTLFDLLEPGVLITPTMKAFQSTVDARGFERSKNVYVYPRAQHVLSPAASDSPSPMAFSFMQETFGNAEIPESVENARKMQAAPPRGVATEMTDFLQPGQRLVRHSPISMDFVHGESERSKKIMDPVIATHVHSHWHQRKFLGKPISRREQHWKATKNLSLPVLLHVASSQRAKEGLSPASSLLPKRGREEEYSGARTSVFECSHAYTNTPPLLSDTVAAVKTSVPFIQRPVGAVEQSSVPPATGFSVLPIPREHVFWQKSRTATLFPHPHKHVFASKRKTQTDAQLMRAFIAMESPEGIPARNIENDGKGNTPVVQATALPIAGSNKRKIRKTNDHSSRGDEHVPHAAVSLFLEGVNRESGDEADERAVPGMKNELRPVRESRIYRVMLYLVAALDYSVAVLQVVCLINTWCLAAKIGTMFGLKILKVPF